MRMASIVLTLLLGIMLVLGLACDGGDPCFSVDSKVITINGSNFQVWEYEDAAAADTEAAFISPDGYSIFNNNNRKMCAWEWVAPPHFYKASNLIVLYVGDNQAVIDALETLLGPQFAGSLENDWQ